MKVIRHAELVAMNFPLRNVALNCQVFSWCVYVTRLIWQTLQTLTTGVVEADVVSLIINLQDPRTQKCFVWDVLRVHT